jgi:hypothetical protein
LGRLLQGVNLYQNTIRIEIVMILTSQHKMTTTVYNHEGAFLTFTTLHPNQFLIVPDSMEGNPYLQDVELTSLVKRSKRHSYKLYKLDSRMAKTIKTYPAYPLPYTIRSNDNMIKLKIVGLDTKLIVYVTKWVYRGDGVYHIQTNTHGDPRWNGCAVLCDVGGDVEDDIDSEELQAQEGNALVVSHKLNPNAKKKAVSPAKTYLYGVAISPVGFEECVEVIPLDIFQESKSCYTSVLPAHFYQPHGDSKTCYVSDFGVLPVSFRHVDKEAECGRDVFLPLEGDKKLWITGGIQPEFPCLSYEPCIEVGDYIFRRADYNKVICSTDIATSECDPITLPYMNPVIKQLDDMTNVTFDMLQTFFAQNPSNKEATSFSFCVKWWDGRVQFITVEELSHSYGIQLSKFACMWFPNKKTTEQATLDQVAEQEEKQPDDVASCTDGCNFELENDLDQEDVDFIIQEIIEAKIANVDHSNSNNSNNSNMSDTTLHV